LASVNSGAAVQRARIMLELETLAGTMRTGAPAPRNRRTSLR
jgi:hypothetical protein